MRRARSHTATAIFVVVAVDLIALSLLGFAWIQYDDSLTFIEKAQPAVGEVIALDLPSADSTDGPLTPVVRYQLNRSDVRDLRPAFAAVWGGYQVGQRLTVLYDPNDPAEARIDDFWQLWFLPLATAAGGLVLLVVPSTALLLVLARNERDRAAENSMHMH